MADITKARVKMYRIQELGDCFLLTFTKGPKEVNMLIDCGAFRQSKTRLIEIATDIQTQLKGKPLDVVVGTHQHNDHVNGFLHAKEVFDKITIDQVWLSWLDNPKDKMAREVGNLYNNFTSKLTMISDHLSRIPANRTSSAFKDTKKQLDNTMEALGLGKNRKQSEKFPPDAPKKAIAIMKKMGEKPVEYLKPGKVIGLPGLESEVKIYVLGPPRKEDHLFDKSPAKDESYGPHGLMMMDTLADKFLSGMKNYVSREDSALEEHFPFNNKFKIKENQLDPSIKRVYTDRKKTWQTINTEWLTQAARMGLWIDDFTNNSSLVLAIELVKTGKILLFVADAMTGNWASWKEIKWDNGMTMEDMLSRTVLYKVGHHGSHNASYKPLCELMTHKDLIAMIPVDKTDGNLTKEKNPWQMPAKKLNKRLIELTKNRVMRMDETFAKNCNPKTEPAKSSWKRSKAKVKFNDMFVEVQIADEE